MEDTVRDGIEKYLPNLKRYAMSLCRKIPHDADDLVNVTIVRALQKRDQFVEGTNLRAWLFTIMHNQHINQVRKISKDLVDKSANPEIINFIPSALNSEDQILIKELVACLKKLPSEQARIVILVGYHGMSYEQAARIEKLEVGTVRSRLSRGREMLRNLMEGTAITNSDELDLIERWGKSKWN